MSACPPSVPSLRKPSPVRPLPRAHLVQAGSHLLPRAPAAPGTWLVLAPPPGHSPPPPSLPQLQPLPSGLPHPASACAHVPTLGSPRLSSVTSPLGCQTQIKRLKPWAPRPRAPYLPHLSGARPSSQVLAHPLHQEILLALTSKRTPDLTACRRLHGCRPGLSLGFITAPALPAPTLHLHPNSHSGSCDSFKHYTGDKSRLVFNGYRPPSSSPPQFLLHSW